MVSSADSLYAHIIPWPDFLIKIFILIILIINNIIMIIVSIIILRYILASFIILNLMGLILILTSFTTR